MLEGARYEEEHEGKYIGKFGKQAASRLLRRLTMLPRDADNPNHIAPGVAAEGGNVLVDRRKKSLFSSARAHGSARLAWGGSSPPPVGPAEPTSVVPAHVSSAVVWSDQAQCNQSGEPHTRSGAGPQ